jgi:thiamine biosynthesis lipoprotein
MTARVLTQRATRGHAMGSDLHVVVVGDDAALDDALDQARTRIAALEARWSRFRSDSEITRVNNAGGAPVAVSFDTFVAVTAAVDAWRRTGGRFDPTVLRTLRASGYDRDFRSLAPAAPGAAPLPCPAPGCAGVELDHLVRSVRLPPGVELDLGGIGKGLAADLVVRELLDAGLAGASVNVGGDVRVGGSAPGEHGWVVDVEHAPGVLLALRDGAVATSSRLRRRWTRGDEHLHHLLDPASGRPADTGIAAITVVAGTAAGAEVLTKAAFVAGPRVGAAIVADAGATGLLLLDDGTITMLDGIDAFLR